MTNDGVSDFFEDQQRLKRNPTKNAWEREIEYLLEGKRQALVLELGSYAQYVARLLADSQDRVKAKLAFKKGFEAAIRSWRPESPSLEYNLALLELVAEYTPPNAFEKIVVALQKWGALSPRELADPDANQTGTLKALRALEFYYPSRPPQNSSDHKAFEDYANLLYRFAGKFFYAPHCCRRLIELKLLDVKGSDMAALRGMLEMPGVIEEFLQYALGIHRGVLEEYIGYVLDCCLSVYDRNSAHNYPLYDRFKRELLRLGAAILDPERRVLVLSFRESWTGKNIELLTTNLTFARYRQASDWEVEELTRKRFAAQAERTPAWNEST